ncbi:MAG: TRAP transporter large permease, partial [Bacteroidetes bacterium]|nr:TRAP transporter large permease [Bacteroidota bacterium]
MEYIEIFILVLSFLIFLALGVPIAYSIGFASVLTIVVSMDAFNPIIGFFMGELGFADSFAAFSVPFTTVAQRMGTGLDSFALLAVPFFILAGQLMNHGGIASRLITFAKVLIGWLPGGLAHVNIIANMLFGAISGSAAASASAIGGVMHKRMVDEGYDPELSAAVNISSATTGLIIPPSNILIVYSVASGGVSIGTLFVAGYIPGILVGLLLMVIAAYFAVKRKYPVDQKIYANKAIKRLLNAIPGLAMLVGLGYLTRFVSDSSLNGILQWMVWLFIWGGYAAVMYVFYKGIHYNNLSSLGKILTNIAFALVGGVWAKIDQRESGSYYRFTMGAKTFVDAFPSLLMLVVVIGGIIAGIFTATEASAIAVLYALILAFIYKEINAKDLPQILLDSVGTTSIVMVLIATCMAMSWVMAFENIP